MITPRRQGIVQTAVKIVLLLLTILMGAALLVVFASPTHADMGGRPWTDDTWIVPEHYIIRADDGGTVVVTLSNLPDVFGKNIPIRQKNLSLPEIYSQCVTEKQRMTERLHAMVARNYLNQWIKQAEEIRIVSPLRGRGEFILLANLYIDGTSVYHRMIERGHATPSTIETAASSPWCNSDFLEEITERHMSFTQGNESEWQAIHRQIYHE